jgi:hypothetical protein
VERKYYPDGSLEEEAHYRGVSSHGPWRRWHPNGVLALEWFYDKNVWADGVHRTWHPNGALAQEMTMVGGRCVKRACFDEKGRAVPSPDEKRMNEMRKFIERTGEKSKQATPPKRRKKKGEEEVERHDQFIAERLAAKTVSAREWLAESNEQSTRNLGEMDTAVSMLLVETLLSLGVAEVLAVEVEVIPGTADETANHLVVRLPSDPAARARVLHFERAHARRLGFDSEGDWGQEHVFMMLC